MPQQLFAPGSPEEDTTLSFTRRELLDIRDAVSATLNVVESSQARPSAGALS